MLNGNASTLNEPLAAESKFRFDQSPGAALSALGASDRRLIVDLDETLYLRNSTEDFIDTAVPGLVAMVLMKLLDLLKPWRFTGGEVTRDVWRVGAIAIFLPWTMRRWHGRVRDRAARFTNRPLLDVIRARESGGVQINGPTVVATFGFMPIVKPLIETIGLAGTRIVACRMFSFADRRQGKLAPIVAALGADAVREAFVVTDSVDDLPLLAASAHPARVVWPDARYETALSRVYMPLEYLARIKRPGERYFVRGIVQDEFIYWIMTTIALASRPLTHVCGLFFLLISFWAIYECGYVDNDIVGKNFEHDPKLSKEFFSSSVATPMLQPWLWALICGAVGTFLIRYPETPAILDFAWWVTALVLIYGWFRLYNRIDKHSRVWMFPGLQLARASAFVVLVPITVVGTAIVAAHVISRWVPYLIYRHGDKVWPDAQTPIIRLVFFLVVAALLGFALGPATVLNYTGLALLLWTVYRARREIAEVFQAARRIDRG